MVQHGLGCKGVRSPWCAMSFGANIGRRVGCVFFFAAHIGIRLGLWSLFEYAITAINSPKHTVDFYVMLR